MTAAVLTCSICSEPSSDICVFCTKDACANHRCDRCKRCSDCCECDVPLSAEEAHVEHEVAPEVASATPEYEPTQPSNPEEANPEEANQEEANQEEANPEEGISDGFSDKGPFS